jgi:RNA polymerase sigma-70 factor (ECF subfamily)
VPSTESNAVLVESARRGDAASLEALARAYIRACYVVALSVMRRASDAEDVAQDAMLLALERIDSCREPAKFSAWLFQIVRNQARNSLDRRRLRDVPADDGPQDCEDVGGAGDGLLRRRLLDALATLAPVRREVVLLHDLEGWTHPEIADALGMSELSSRQHLFQARRQLRDRLGDESCAGGVA